MWPDDFYTPQKGQKVVAVCMYDRVGGKEGGEQRVRLDSRVLYYLWFSTVA